jgi:hypothetical protein
MQPLMVLLDSERLKANMAASKVQVALEREDTCPCRSETSAPRSRELLGVLDFVVRVMHIQGPFLPDQ